MNNGFLDRDCPNYFRHGGRRNQSKRHELSSDGLLRSFRDQLSQDLDHFCVDLDIRGARGALFQITLREYGYTVVAKGTVRCSVGHLRHELRVYGHLQPLQGQCIPVCIGNVDLVNPYHYGFGLEVVHMMFLAWGSQPLGESQISESIRSEEKTRSLAAINDRGVLHGDMHQSNVLWNEEVRRAMVIDFDRLEVM